jgi:hypothetical protein
LSEQLDVEFDEEYFQAISQSFDRALQATTSVSAAIIDACSPDSKWRWTIVRLFNFCESRATTIKQLLVLDRVWDAEIIARSLSEAHTKIWKLSFSMDDESVDLKEFLEDHWRIQSGKDSNKAANIEAVATNHGDENAKRIFRFLQREDFFPRPTVSKLEKRRIEVAWSFTKILSLVDESYKHKYGEMGLLALQFMYGMQSHIAHADAKGLDLIEDDKQRRGEDGFLKRSSHEIRILGDILSYWNISNILLNAPENHADLFKRSTTLWDEFSEVITPIQNSFNRSQDDFYTTYS